MAAHSFGNVRRVKVPLKSPFRWQVAPRPHASSPPGSRNGPSRPGQRGLSQITGLDGLARRAQGGEDLFTQEEDGLGGL